jgi:hypothetical protein
VSCLGYLQLQSKGDIKRVAQELPAVAPSVATTSGRESAVSVVDLAALQQEVTSLKAETAELQHRLIAGHETQPAMDARSVATARAESDREHQVAVDSIEAGFHRQVVDSAWSASTTSAIQRALSGEQGGGIQAENIDCRSSTCRVELRDDSSSRIKNALPTLLMQIGESTPTVTANTIPLGNGTATVVLYLSRGDEATL